MSNVSDSNVDDDYIVDVDVGDDALDELIQQAESLMTDLDQATKTLDISDVDSVAVGGVGGFSIDSDGEDEEGEGGNVIGDPLSSSTAAAAAAAAPVDDHPLSMENLSAPASYASAPTGVGGPHSSSNPNSNGSPGMSSFFSSSGTGTLPVGVPGINGTAGMAAAAAMAGGVAGIDSLKLQTSRLASGIASIAQRAANQVAAAAAPVQVAGGPAPMGYPMNHINANNSNHHLHNAAGYGAANYPGQMPAPNRTPPTARNTSSTPNAKPVVELDKDQKDQLLKEHVGSLLPGERIIMFLSNLLHVGDTSGLSYLSSQQQSSSDNSHMWCCAMSYYRLILFSTAPLHRLEIPKPADWNAACWPASPSATKIIEVPLASMDRIEKTVYQAGGSSFMGIVVYTKDCGRIVRFTTPNYADTGRVFDSLNSYAFPGRRNLGYLFAFESKRQEVMASVQVDAVTGQQNITLPPTPKRFDPMMEYPRLLNQTSITNAPWMIWASLNSSYQLSPTYPAVMVGPATLDENKPESQHVIRQCASFRSEQRLPALSWCGVGGASIWRASQPKVGLQGNRSPADELFLRHVTESARGANAMADPLPIYSRAVLQQLTGDYGRDWVPEQGCGLKILDLRPRASAMANRTAGYGYENTSYYNNSTIQFCNVGNIHSVRDSYQKLCSVCNSESTTDVNFHSLIEDTKWLSHIRIILAAAWEAAYWVHVWRMPILIHCSHGWDRTSQVSALAQLLLDPYYRTRHGFSVLVEKDFMSFGHPFHLRCAHGEGRSQMSTAQQSTNDEGQISPIFLQFLDCVYQIVQLYPDSFEFNTQYLFEMSFHIYSCRFGTMLCDTERERETLAGIRLRTYSLWDFLDSKPECRNDSFSLEPTQGTSGGVLLMPLPTLLRNVRLWMERHCFYSRKPTIVVRSLPLSENDVSNNTKDLLVQPESSSSSSLSGAVNGGA